MPHRILLVEDNELNRDVLSQLLELRGGFEVVTAEDGEMAIEVALEKHPDLILMDVSLPKIDGYEATRRLRKMEGFEQLPIIALTAHAMLEDRERAMLAGTTDFETKPVEMPRLLAKIRSYLPEA